MAGYFAELQNNIVQKVVNSETKEWCETALGGEWVQTYYNTPGKNYAGIGFTYIPEKDNFCTPKPYPSWLLDDSCIWQAPIECPNDGMYIWDEDNLVWNKIN